MRTFKDIIHRADNPCKQNEEEPDSGSGGDAQKMSFRNCQHRLSRLFAGGCKLITREQGACQLKKSYKPACLLSYRRLYLINHRPDLNKAGEPDK
jgi:hypothetical protein